MTAEQYEPDSGPAATPQTAPPFMDQAQESPNGQPTAQQRRRRRRRKASKGFTQAPPVPDGQVAISGEGPTEPPPAAAPPQAAPMPAQHKQHSQKKARQQQQQPGGQNGNGFQNSQQNGQPRNFQKSNGAGMSNGGSQQQGARRKNKQRRPAPSFVGPMDHSYRMANGNVADGSNGDYRNNYRSDRDLPNGNIAPRNQYMDPSEVPAAIRADAPTRILCFIEDLFVVAKLQETAKKLGVKVGFLKADKDIVARLTDTPESERPSLIVFDLNNASAKPLALIPKLKAKLKRGTSVIGFLSHIQGDLKVKAIEAGCDMVMPKSAFSQNLPNLLRRHGLEEELEAVEA